MSRFDRDRAVFEQCPACSAGELRPWANGSKYRCTNPQCQFVSPCCGM